MIGTFQDYLIELVDELDFTLNSTDNRFVYSNIYFDENQNKPASKHGIKVTKDGQTVTSALICEAGSPSGIHENSFLIKGDSLFLCCSNEVYSFELPDLTLNWKKELDPATCFSIYPFKDDLIIHGEMEVKRIDLLGNVKWGFSGADIFVTPDGKSSVIFMGDRIKLIDWEGNHYILSEHGSLI